MPGNLIHRFFTASIIVDSAGEQKMRLKNSTRSPTVSLFCSLTVLAFPPSFPGSSNVAGFFTA
jgi:hypothetical protein